MFMLCVRVYVNGAPLNDFQLGQRNCMQRLKGCGRTFIQTANKQTRTQFIDDCVWAPIPTCRTLNWFSIIFDSALLLVFFCRTNCRSTQRSTANKETISKPSYMYTVIKPFYLPVGDIFSFSSALLAAFSTFFLPIFHSPTDFILRIGKCIYTHWLTSFKCKRSIQLQKWQTIVS